MTLETISYLEQAKLLPESGQHILGQQNGNHIVVYQAYNNVIADYATYNQKLGGFDFSYNRMSWIKPNFIWMMYRCGWAEKENQENVIAIWIKKCDFDFILENAVYSSFQDHLYLSRNEWKNELSQKEVRLQWDPDHDPFGNKLERRAIQLGLKGAILKSFGEEMIQKVENITDLIKSQKQFIEKQEIHNLIVPRENIYLTKDQSLNGKLGIA